MNNIENLQGSIVAIVTPFNNNGSIDYESLGNLLQFHLDNNTHGILVCGTTGETATLSNDEYREVIEFTVSNINGRLPVIAGTGTNSTATTIENCTIAGNAGVDGFLIVGPYYNKPTANGFYAHYSQVAQSTNLPIIIYNVPGRTGQNIPTDIILRLANEFENIVAVKEASGDITQIMDILNRRPEDFRVYSGDDSLAYPLMCLGADGCISVVANEIPLEFSQMIELALNENYNGAREIHYKYLELMNMNFIESNPQPVKTVLSLMGLIQENFRLPICEMETKNRNQLEELITDIELINN